MRAKREKLTAERLRALLSYDPLTGVWTRNVARRGFAVGSKAGHVAVDGYLRLMIDGWHHRSARLAVLYMTGKWPPEVVDHMDRDKSNDRWDNLRLASRSRNQANTPTYANNKVGVKGVYHYPNNKNYPYVAQIRHGGKTYHLGSFVGVEEAGHAYMVAAKKVFGEFASGGKHD